MSRKPGRNALHGWLALDKPVGISSNQALGRLKRLLSPTKIGHAGTLDPLASGMLPVAFGEATKTVSHVMDGPKTYEVTIRWGAATTTDDLEGEVTEQSDKRPQRSEIETVLAGFIGEIEQMPPKFSAIKVGGQRAYALARKGDVPALKPRQVTISSLDLIECPDADHARFKVRCGKGTYIRSLARDIGEKLGCFGHVSALRRSSVEPFAEAGMITLEKLEEMRHKGGGFEAVKTYLAPIETVLDDIPALAIEKSEAQRLRQGQPVLLKGRDAPVRLETVLVTSANRPVAIGRVEKGELRTKRVFNLEAGQ